MPTSYRLRILRAEPAPPAPTPPGWYDVASFAVAGDVAVDEEGEDVRTRPERTSVELGFADLVTATFTP